MSLGVMADGIPHNTSLPTKTTLDRMAPRDLYGAARTIQTRGWQNIRTSTSRSRIHSIAAKSHACPGMSDHHRKANERHDVGLQIVGQPARDLCRHFVQRWNLLIRTKVGCVRNQRS